MTDPVLPPGMSPTGASALELAERDLFKRGVMAVSVEQAALRPGETTQLFVIRERRADD